MDTRDLGGLTVTEICLGTMTFGHDTDRAAAFAQMDRALDAGITFWDTAEMYPVNPATAEAYGLTETIIGEYLASRGARGRVQIATKASGKGGGGRFSRGNAGFGADAVAQAVDGSLRRLGTDRIDLYQLHWPERGSYAFRQNWRFDPRGTPAARVRDHMDGVLTSLRDLVAAGKVGRFGLSNETAWGMMQWMAAAERTGGPAPVSIQNEYSALCRLYDTDLAELGEKEGITLLAYSPLAAGLLSGKYAGGATPASSRAAGDVTHGGPGDLGGRRTANAAAAVDAWLRLAGELGHDPVQMAIAFVRQRPFPAIPIIGATTPAQLDHLIAGLTLRLDRGALAAIDRFHRDHPLPY
ncbi:aldo/keto reductase [Paracoccus luteus]|uniref:aldo/keto reductase n=1 Tax=Paracoccus luteus TaxID=2508543 RepID=UPI00106F492F|nr:aldo/keto reductase [Paracoccus luteus]